MCPAPPAAASQRPWILRAAHGGPRSARTRRLTSVPRSRLLDHQPSRRPLEDSP
jgi:hypothetical protein